MTAFCIQVFDNFYQNPQELRQQALSTAINISGGNPGLSSKNIDVDKHMNYVGQMLKIEPDYKHLQHISHFRMTRGSDEIKDTDIHQDGPCYAGVCFLNLPEQCSGGTTFFKHKKTGLDSWPSRQQSLEFVKAGKLPPKIKDEEEEILYWEEQGKDRTKWEKTMHIPMRFNRAMFFNGNQFHSMTSWREFGETKNTARMTMVYIFHEL